MAQSALDTMSLADLPAWPRISSPEEVRVAALDAALAALGLAGAVETDEVACPLCGEHQTAERLSDHVAEELPRVAEAIATGGAEGFALYLEGFEDAGPALAEHTRDDGATLTAAKALVRVAYALWCGRVRTRMLKEKAKVMEDALRRHPGVPLPLVDSCRLGTWGHPRAVETGDDGQVLIDGDGRVLAQLDPSRIPAVSPDLLTNIQKWAHSGAELLGSLNAHRLIRWLAWEAHSRHQPGQVAILPVVGGWQALARLVGARSKKASDKLRDIVWCLDAHRFALPDGTLGRLLTVDRYQPARGPGRSARIDLLPGAPLRPNYIFELRRPERKVVPVLARLPPMVGREREHGALAELHWRVLVEMRRRCREMVGESQWEDRGLPLAPARWRELGDLARVPAATLAQILDRWTRDGRDGPAFLRPVDEHRYTLGPGHDDARIVLLHYGWKEARGSKAGKQSAQSRGNQGPTRGRKKSR